MNDKTLFMLCRESFDYVEGNLIWKVIKSRVRIGTIAGSISGRGYVNIKLNQKAYLAHRLVYLWHYGYLPAVLDHINGDPRDNRIENLRAATPSQNQHNRSLNRNNTSGYKGVCWNKGSKKWQAKVKKNNVYKHLGFFDDILDAAKVVADYRIEMHGEFAKHQ